MNVVHALLLIATLVPILEMEQLAQTALMSTSLLQRVFVMNVILVAYPVQEKIMVSANHVKRVTTGTAQITHAVKMMSTLMTPNPTV